MNHLTEEQLEALYAALDAERTDLEEQLAGHGKKVDGDWTGTAEGFEEESDDDAEDEADRFEELGTNVALVEELEARLKDVNRAIVKITKKKEYGICENTGEPIPFERLEANPAARTLVDAE
jgi:RNA polymerase-binding transcription factor DksA